jgi:hypothetical protein
MPYSLRSLVCAEVLKSWMGISVEPSKCAVPLVATGEQ